MDVTSAGPFSVGSLLWQRHSGNVLTVVAKATFALLPGESTLADEQEPVNLADDHLEDDPARSLQAPSDLVPFKARADVVLVGYAFAPRGEPVRSLIVRLVVGDVDKSIEVVGDRAYALDGALREGPRFARMALRYERAAGGPDTANPIGVSEGAPPDPYGMSPLPNLQPVGFVPSRRGEVIPSVGFGPIPATWPARRERLGRHAPLDRWDGPLPADLDPAYFNCAPRDQQTERIRDNERLVLENLHPQHPRLVTSLPGVRPRAFTDRGDGQPQEIALVCDTLWIDTGRGLCTLTWRGYVEGPTAEGRVVIVGEQPGRPIDWSEVQGRARPSKAPPAPPREHRPKAKTLPFVAMSTPPEAALPFQPAGGAPPAPPRPSASASRLAAMTPSAPRAPGGDPLTQTLSEEGEETHDTGPSWLQGAGRSGPAPAPVSPVTIATPPAPVPPAPVPLAPMPPAPVPPAPVVMPPPVVPALSAPAAVVPSSPWAAGPPITAAAVVATAVPLAAPPLAPPAGTGRSSVPPPSPSPGNAQPGSAAAASDAAAGAPARAAATSSAQALPSPADKRDRAPVTEVLDLVWYDDRSVPRVRSRWEALCTKLDFEPVDPGEDLGADDPEKAKARHHVFGVLSDGDVIDGAGVARAVHEAVGRRGRFTPPLTLVAGEIRFPFDEIETLRATITAISPLAGNDKKLKESIDAMSALLETPYLQGGAGVVEKLTQQLRAEFREQGRGLPAGYLDGHVERFLLEQRRYAIRKVFGGEFIRALLVGPTPQDAPIPVYLPRHLDQTLPMVVTLRARLIAEAHLQQDPYDTSPYALRAVTLGRALPIDGLRPAGKAQD